MRVLTAGRRSRVLGVGTVTTAAEAQAALDAGASYLVTPVTEVSVIEIARRRGVPVYPGGSLPRSYTAAGRREPPR